MLDSVVALPTIYVCAVVFGFMLNTCTNKKEVQRLKDQIDDLEWDLSIARHKLEIANEKLEAIRTQAESS
jgi:hypothetical protein